jgi:hypothetical protein
MAIGNILWSFGIFYGHLVYFMAIWYIFPRFGILRQEKSGNLAEQHTSPASTVTFLRAAFTGVD